MGGKLAEGNAHLLAAGQVLHRGLLVPDLVVAEDDGHTSTAGVGLAEAGAHATLAAADHGCELRRPKLLGELDGCYLGRRPERCDEDVRRLRFRKRGALLAHVE